MKTPKITFEWSWEATPKDIHIRKLSNGFTLFDTYVKDERDLADYLVMILKNPEANLPTPIYQKEKET